MYGRLASPLSLSESFPTLKMEKIRIIIAEDDYVVARHLSLVLEEEGYYVAGICETGEELLEWLKNERPDLLLLDINLAGRLDGIATASLLKERFSIPFLYLTANRDVETLQKAKITRPSAYLIKPFDTDELRSAIELALYNFSADRTAEPSHAPVVAAPVPEEDVILNRHCIFVKAKNRLVKVAFDDILFAEANDIYATLYTATDRHIISYPLKTLEERFPAQFVRVHRSFLVNANHIQAIEDSQLLIGTHEVPIGKTYRELLMKRLSIM